ncbi:two-component system response regulator CreB [Lysobacter sp. K5869]|uniref:two-component system response regulator CreB n=1 Tax=Lysobacter sp. K5869 TaxID=2820808 RepID=UPI001C05F080|nr:two-component system response regulator CreB [Lysobacter sp. K5869]QWP76146.1 two-component system response regulator CreB [Lysobacter sp. K5869]
MRILLVEDESAIADTVLYALRAEGFEAVHCLTGGEALREAARTPFDLAVLDIGLPDIGGFALCRELRRGRDLPVIFLTAQNAEADRILGLEIGADDYVTKPFSPRELATRVRVVLRRAGVAGAGVSASAGNAGAAAEPDPGFVHDSEGKRIRYRGQALDLTRYEYGLLAALLQRPGAVLSRAQLMDRVWGDALDSGDRTVDTHIKTLRAKLREVDADGDPIRTHRGLGYSLDNG